MTNSKPFEANRQWDRVYSEQNMTMWYPHEAIIRFCAGMIQKRLTLDKYDVKRKVERVLDLGCGNGRHAIYFASQGIKAYGIDISKQAIDWASDWAMHEKLEVEFRVGNITELPYEDEFFDAVVTHGVLDHVPMTIARKAINEVRRVIKPNGLFYCDFRCVEDSDFGVGDEIAHNEFILTDGYEEGLVQHFFAEDEIKSLVDGLFRIIYSEIQDIRFAPDYKKKSSRWSLTTEAI